MEERSQNHKEFGGGSNPKKRREANGEEEQQPEDRISTLPESLILRILSRLPVHEVIKTSTLSKRWQHLWTIVPDLSFKRERGMSRQRFISFVSKTLALRRCPKIDKLSFTGRYEPLGAWIETAAKSKVEVLELCLFVSNPHRNGLGYRLPDDLYKNSSIREMKLVTCIVEPIGIISWSSLKKLYVDYVKLNNDVIERILSGCPVLESLELSHFSGFNRLHVTSPSLRKLCLRKYLMPLRGDDVLVEIFAPHIRSLEISNYQSWKIRLLNVSSLVDAFLDFYPKVNNDWEESGIMLLEVLEHVHNVKNLTLGTWCVQVMLLLGVKGRPSPLLKCKSLKLLARFKKWEFPAIELLLQSSPYLETLDINISLHLAHRHFKYRDCDGEKYFALEEHNSKCLLLHLKCVKVFCLRRPCPELVQYVLTHASVLEKMIICTEREEPPTILSIDGSSMSFTSLGSLQVAQMLEGFLKSSPDQVSNWLKYWRFFRDPDPMERSRVPLRPYRIGFAIPPDKLTRD